MRKEQFLSHPETKKFVQYFAAALDGSRRIDFRHSGGSDARISDALFRYAWPHRRATIHAPTGDRDLPAWSGLEANNLILQELSRGIRRSLTRRIVQHTELNDWSRAILQWGGVLTGRGNGRWLESMSRRRGLADYFRRATNALKRDDELGISALRDLRSNAGMTKVYSLLLDDFVIYDSRVAAALAWLVYRWAQHERVDVPEHLRFVCMKGRTTKTRMKLRSPDKEVFPFVVASGPVENHVRHARWNLRANWIIQAAINHRGRSISVWDSRKVEAALFMMGEDLSLAVNQESIRC